MVLPWLELCPADCDLRDLHDAIPYSVDDTLLDVAVAGHLCHRPHYARRARQCGVPHILYLRIDIYLRDTICL